MGPSGAWGVPGVLNLVYKWQKTPTAYNGGHLITVWTAATHRAAASWSLRVATAVFFFLASAVLDTGCCWVLGAEC
jgi:hypothetical protein